MIKMEEEIIFEEDKCFVETPIYPNCGKGKFVKRQLVMTKEIFVECYNKWIKEDNNAKVN